MSENFIVPPEDQALLDVLRHPGPPCPSVISEEKWGTTASRARLRGVEPFLYRHLLKGGFRVPPRVLERLRHSYLAATARNVILLRQLEETLPLFARAGIPVIALKGAALAEPYYGDLGCRTMGDVDLLMYKEHLPEAKGFLEKAGFRQMRRIPVDQEIIKWHHISPFYFPGSESSLVLELHWRLLRPGFPCRDAEDLWRDARRESIAGTAVFSLGPEDLLLYTCLHALDHGYDRGLDFLLDLKIILDRHAEESDWALAFDRAVDLAAAGGLSLGILLAHDLLGAPVPEQVHPLLQAHRPGAEMFDAALRQTFETSDRRQALTANLTRLHQAQGMTGKGRFLLKKLFPPSSDLAARYPVSRDSPLFPLLHLVHPLNMLRHHGREAWNLILGEKGHVAADEANRRKDELKKTLAGIC